MHILSVLSRLVVILVFGVAVSGALTDQAPTSEVKDHHDKIDKDKDLKESDSDRKKMQTGGEKTEVSDTPETIGLWLRTRGSRLDATATTDVWAHDGFAYTGTFNGPCGGDPNAGVWIWQGTGSNADFVGIIPSPTGSKANDIKVAEMNSGDILVHSNEVCNAGPGGFEIYNVDDPNNPLHLASVRIKELNEVVPTFFAPGALDNAGVHNLWLFKQDDRDYVGVVAGSEFDQFRIYEITDPVAPVMMSAWGAEELIDPGVGDTTLLTDPDGTRTLAAFSWVREQGYGSSKNRGLHDITGVEDGDKMYLASWDAGLILLDISDVSYPMVVSVALDPVNGSLDGEVNSHSVWPSEDGTIVVEGEEDFAANVSSKPSGNFTFQNLPTNTIAGVGIATTAGDVFEANQTGNMLTVSESSVSVYSGSLVGQTFAAIEPSGNQPKIATTGSISGEAVWIGRACNGDAILNAAMVDVGDIAVVRRGACAFSEKLANAAAAGAAAVVISNNLSNDTPWGGVRIWDYTDPTKPVLASVFNTVCSAHSVDPSCDPLGTYTLHNVVVSSKDDRVLAYLSWYYDGVLVLDVTDPYNPIEIARYSDDTAAFQAQNGGPQDVWGVYKEQGKNRIYISDRNGGLYVLKLTDD